MISCFEENFLTSLSVKSQCVLLLVRLRPFRTRALFEKGLVKQHPFLILNVGCLKFSGHKVPLSFDLIKECYQCFGFFVVVLQLYVIREGNLVSSWCNIPRVCIEELSAELVKMSDSFTQCEPRFRRVNSVYVLS